MADNGMPAPELFVIPVGAKWLLYSPAGDHAALVNSAAVRRLTGGASLEGLGLGELTRGDPDPEARSRADGYAPSFLGLIPTRACNLECSYCAFQGGSAGREEMSPALATAAIEWHAADCLRRGVDTLDVHLFGGEPLAARDIVDVIVHRSRAVAAREGLIPHLETATNGVYSRDTARFVADYFDVVALSFDGPPPIHNLYRRVRSGGGSYDTVAATAGVFSDSRCDLIFRACVTSGNVDAMADTVGWFCERFQPTVIDFEPLVSTPEAAAAGLTPPPGHAFAQRFLEAREVGRRFSIEVTFSGSKLDWGARFCPLLDDGLIVSPDGKIGACYLLPSDWQRRGLDLHLGRVSEDGRVTLSPVAIDRIRKLAGLGSRCAQCFCRMSCAGGCRVNRPQPAPPSRDDDFCVEARLITAALLLERLGSASLGREVVESEILSEAIMARSSDLLVPSGVSP